MHFDDRKRAGKADEEEFEDEEFDLEEVLRLAEEDPGKLLDWEDVGGSPSE